MITGMARTVGAAGLATISGLHAAWAAGSNWPAKNRKRLAEAVAGNRKEMPEQRTTAAVAAGAAAGGIVAAGAFGDGRFVVGLRRTLGIGFLLRAASGGDAALAALGLPEGGKRFQRLDERWYRPLFAVLGIALLLGAKRRVRP